MEYESQEIRLVSALCLMQDQVGDGVRTVAPMSSCLPPRAVVCCSDINPPETVVRFVKAGEASDLTATVYEVLTE
jgi:hypothetical protein